MSRQEDFDKQSDEYVDRRKSFGLNDPYALKEIGEAYYQGCEYGYQYAVDRACEVIAKLYPQAAAYYEQTESFVEQIRKAMEEL